MRRNDALKWMEIAGSAAVLGMESAAVIGLRFAGAAAGGPKALDEAWLMWSEKVNAFVELQTRLVTGSLGSTPAGAVSSTLKHYRRKVAANRRRLSR